MKIQSTCFTTPLLVVVLALLGCQAQPSRADDGLPVAEKSAKTMVEEEPEDAAGKDERVGSLPIQQEVAVDLDPAVEEVVRLAEGGVGDAVLIAYIKRSGAEYELSAEELLYLRDLGLSDEVMTVLIEHSEGNGSKRKSQGVEPQEPEVEVEGQAAGGQATEYVAPPADLEEPADPVERTEVVHEYFYRPLSPYGTWIDVPGRGLCWRPSVAVIQSGWRPYRHRGRWLHSDHGWYWHSDYSWGWATFHYGRWWEHPGYGWVWVPGTTWAPSWVVWRQSDSYYGWAPLPPGTYYESGIGVTYSEPGFSLGFSFGLGHSAYTFVPKRHFFHHHPWHHAVGHTQVVNVFNETTVINNFTKNSNNTIINEGIGPNIIASETRSEVRKVSVREVSESVPKRVKPDRLVRQGDETVVFRPQTGSERTDGAGGRQVARKEERADGKGTAGDSKMRVQPNSARGSGGEKGSDVAERKERMALAADAEKRLAEKRVVQRSRAPVRKSTKSTGPSSGSQQKARSGRVSSRSGSGVEGKGISVRSRPDAEGSRSIIRVPSEGKKLGERSGSIRSSTGRLKPSLGRRLTDRRNNLSRAGKKSRVKQLRNFSDRRSRPTPIKRSRSSVRDQSGSEGTSSRSARRFSPKVDRPSSKASASRQFQRAERSSKRVFQRSSGSSRSRSSSVQPSPSSRIQLKSPRKRTPVPSVRKRVQGSERRTVGPSRSIQRSPTRSSRVRPQSRSSSIRQRSSSWGRASKAKSIPKVRSSSSRSRQSVSQSRTVRKTPSATKAKRSSRSSRSTRSAPKRVTVRPGSGSDRE